MMYTIGLLTHHHGRLEVGLYMLGALGPQVDVFSFGVVLWEIWTLGDQPYPNLSLQEIFAGVMTGTLRPAVPPGCDPAWVSLMQVRAGLTVDGALHWGYVF
jgi:hypothetical protein